MRAGRTLLIAGLLAILTLSSCVSGPRRFGGEGPPIALEPERQQAPGQPSPRPLPYRPDVLNIGSAHLNYAAALPPTPSRTVDVSPAPPPHPVTTPQRHIVAPGETLFGIARMRLGDEGRWRDILAANPGLEASRLKAGQAISLPR